MVKLHIFSDEFSLLIHHPIPAQLPLTSRHSRTRHAQRLTRLHLPLSPTRLSRLPPSLTAVPLFPLRFRASRRLPPSLTAVPLFPSPIPRLTSPPSLSHLRPSLPISDSDSAHAQLLSPVPSPILPRLTSPSPLRFRRASRHLSDSVVQRPLSEFAVQSETFVPVQFKPPPANTNSVPLHLSPLRFCLTVVQSNPLRFPLPKPSHLRRKSYQPLPASASTFVPCPAPLTCISLRRTYLPYPRLSLLSLPPLPSHLISCR